MARFFVRTLDQASEKHAYQYTNDLTKIRGLQDSSQYLSVRPVLVTQNALGELGSVEIQASQDSSGRTHDLPGATFRRLSNEVAYLKLSSVKRAEAAHYVESAAGTKGLIIDIRNYPSEFVVFALGSLLVEKETPFARFTNGDLSTPGAFHWMKPVSLIPQTMNPLCYYI